MKDKWRSLGACHEVVWHRYSAVSGTDGYNCFCGCGKSGFWTTSRFFTCHSNRISSDATLDGNGDRKCVTPSPHLVVYVWSVVMMNNACMHDKGSVVIPVGVCSEGEVGRVRGQSPSRKAFTAGKRGGGTGKDGSSDDDDSEQEKNKKKKKVNQVSHDQNGATFLDDGKQSKSTRADQTLMTNLILAQNVLEKTDADDTEGVVWAKGKIAKLRETSTKPDVAHDTNDSDIVEAQEKEQELQRV